MVKIAGKCMPGTIPNKARLPQAFVSHPFSNDPLEEERIFFDEKEVTIPYGLPPNISWLFLRCDFSLLSTLGAFAGSRHIDGEHGWHKHRFDITLEKRSFKPNTVGRSSHRMVLISTQNE
ncbi:unnamed protein product [Cylicocyclus nassatus]|uniref:Uncharacterized protein n=1 Tax=Cylicocyclus nassatus TaxID=53992 RepID=A0AA36GZP8_CYLNA|nr:unnamed protein product [Cylicocyclus nassatus]